MLVDRAIFPITTLGPGERLVIWFSGCSKQCRNCSNPELWFADQTKNIEPIFCFKLHPIPKQQKLAGITLTGGDPLEQTEDLIEILPRLRMITNDILFIPDMSMRISQRYWVRNCFASSKKRFLF